MNGQEQNGVDTVQNHLTDIEQNGIPVLLQKFQEHDAQCQQIGATSADQANFSGPPQLLQDCIAMESATPTLKGQVNQLLAASRPSSPPGRGRTPSSSRLSRSRSSKPTYDWEGSTVNDEKDELRSFCRQCGGERRHSLLAEEARPWEEEEDTPVCGNDTWSIVECKGCSNVSFVHSHWFSEEYEMTSDGRSPIIHRDLYPPAPARKPPEWGMDFLLSVPVNDMWMIKLHEDIYSAVGIGAYTLAAMGIRTIIDFVVTSRAQDEGRFTDKLNRLKDTGLLSDMQVGIFSAAFDAGSAAAHRGYSPSLQDVNVLLEAAESLLEEMYVKPARLARHAKEANELKSRTPPRPKS